VQETFENLRLYHIFTITIFRGEVADSRVVTKLKHKAFRKYNSKVQYVDTRLKDGAPN